MRTGIYGFRQSDIGERIGIGDLRSVLVASGVQKETKPFDGSARARHVLLEPAPDASATMNTLEVYVGMQSGWRLSSLWGRRG